LTTVSLAQQLLDAGEEIDWHGEDYGGVLFHADFRQRLQVTQLDAHRFGGQKLGGVHQALGGGELTFRVDDLGTLLALGLGLLGHGAQHGFGHVDLLDLDVGDLHAPGSGVRVENALQAQVDLLPVR